MKQIKLILLLFVSCFLFSGCNTEDDIMKIFVSGEWTLGNYFTAGEMGNPMDPGRPKYIPPQNIDDLNALAKIKMTFNDDMTVDIVLSTASCKARWQCNPSDRSISFTDIKAPSSIKGHDKEFITALKAVRFYAGDSSFIQLGPEDKRSYMQLAHF